MDTSLVVLSTTNLDSLESGFVTIYRHKQVVSEHYTIQIKDPSTFRILKAIST